MSFLPEMLFHSHFNSFSFYWLQLGKTALQKISFFLTCLASFKASIAPCTSSWLHLSKLHFCICLYDCDSVSQSTKASDFMRVWFLLIFGFLEPNMMLVYGEHTLLTCWMNKCKQKNTVCILYTDLKYKDSSEWVLWFSVLKIKIITVVIGVSQII